MLLGRYEKNLALLIGATIAFAAGCREAARTPLVLGVPTTVHDSGLLDALLEEFEQAYPQYRLRLVVGGSGELLALGSRGDVDMLITHSPDAETEFIATGHGLSRRGVMENDFVIVGPAEDPAGVRGSLDAASALGRIAEAGARFISRGDDSGTHRKELELRERAGLRNGGPGYRDAGQGMGEVLRVASELAAYTLCDRATYLYLRETLELDVLVEGDPRLANVYSAIVVANARDVEGAEAFVSWLTSVEGRTVIGGYGMDRFGVPLFEPLTKESATED